MNIPKKIAALNHYHSHITPEDIHGVMQASQDLLQHIKEDFHMIIDNRVAPLSQIYSLAQLQKSAPVLAHPHLNYLVVIKTTAFVLTSNTYGKRKWSHTEKCLFDK